MPSQCTVTGTLQSLTGGVIAQGKVIFQLTNIGIGNPVGVSGTSILPQLTYTIVTAQDGTFSVQLWGNDVITPANTLYAVTFRDFFGNEVGPVLYSITGVSVNLNSLGVSSGTIPPVLINDAVLQHPTVPQTITGQPLTLTASAPLTVLGSLTCKNFGNIACVDQANSQGWAGSEFAAWINSAIASLPSVVDLPSGNSYKAGTVWLAATGAVSQTVTVNISSPFVNIIGPGRQALRFNCTIAGDCWRLNTSPFTTSPAGLLQGFSVIGSSAANQNLLHAGDGIKLKLYDLELGGATGTNATCLWWDNVTGYTEQIDEQAVTLFNCTTVKKYTNTNGSANSQSFGYGNYRNVIILPSPGQTGVWVAAVSGTNPIVLYHSVINWNIENNTGGGTNTFFRIDSGASLQDNVYQILLEENVANGGTMYQFGNNITLTGSGSIVTGATFCGSKTDSLGTGLNINVQQMTFCSAGDQTPAWVNIGGGGNVNGFPHFLNPLAATVTVSQPAPVVGLWGNYWTGSVSALDKWFITPTLGTGANPSTILKLNHFSGSSGLAAVEVPGLIIDAVSGGGTGRQQMAGTANFPLFTWPDPTPATGALVGESLNATSGVYQSKRGTAGCTTSGGATPFTGACTTVVTFPASFADTNFSVTCMGRSAFTGVPILQGATATTVNQATVQTQQATGVNASFATIDCIAVHD